MYHLPIRLKFTSDSKLSGNRGHIFSLVNTDVSQTTDDRRQQRCLNDQLISCSILTLNVLNYRKCTLSSKRNLGTFSKSVSQITLKKPTANVDFGLSNLNFIFRIIVLGQALNVLQNEKLTNYSKQYCFMKISILKNV